MANEFIARKGLIVLSNGAKVTGSLLVSGNINATGYSVTATSFTGSFSGSIGNAQTASYVAYADVANKPTLVSQSSQITAAQITGIGAYATTASNSFTDTQTITGSLFVTSAVSASSFTGSFSGDGSNITGIASTLALSGSSGTDVINLKTDALTVTGSNGVTTVVTDNKITIGIPNGVVSSSTQIDTSQIPGMGAFATTASNSFTGIQTITNTTNSTAFTSGALIVQGGVGIAKDVNISGSLNVTGLLTVVSMSTQYVTSSQYIVGDNRIILNSDDYARFGGMSIFDSGSTSATASIYWDSLNHKFIYENLSGSAYNSAMFIAGPKNTGALGDEVGLTTGRVPVASDADHIDSRPASSSIRVDFPSRLTHIEAGLYVTGAITSSVGFSGDGSNLTGIVTNLNLSGSTSGTGTVSLKTQSLTVSGSNGIEAIVAGQTVTLSGSNATTTSRGVASFTGSNFNVTNGDVSTKPINFNGVDLNLGSSYAYGLQNITPYGASTPDQVTLSGGAIIQGALYTTGSNIDVDAGTEVVATVSTGSYDAGFFDYVVKNGTNYRAGTVTAVWQAGTSNVEFTDVSTNDLGDTSDVVLSVDLLSGNARLKATVTTNNWNVKSIVRAI